MHIEVDQSGKIEQTSWDTVLALSDDLTYAILIPAKVKRAAIAQLRSAGRQRKQTSLLLFSAALYLLLEKHVDQFDLVTIDTEYKGNEQDIKAFLLRLIWRKWPAFSPDRVAFRPIGKASRAHSKALRVYKGEERPDRRIKLAELRKLIG